MKATESGDELFSFDHWQAPALQGVMFNVKMNNRHLSQDCKAEWTDTGLRLWCEMSGRIDIDMPKK